MIELRSMFNNIFSDAEQKQPTTLSMAKLLNSYTNFFTKWDGNLWNDATSRACIDAIARNVAKLTPQHIRRVDGKVTRNDSNLNYLLSQRPNEYVNAYEFYYKLIAQLEIYNNAFAYIRTDINGNITGLYNIDFTSLELKENNNILYCKFTFLDKRITVPYDDVIHIRKQFFDNDIFGSDNMHLKRPIEVMLAAKDSVENSVKNCTKMRGYLKAPGQVMETDKKGIISRFIDTLKSGFGIAVLDATTDYQPLNADLETADNETLEFCRQDLYRAWGVSSAIVDGDFTEEQYNSFYENRIEPIAMLLAQEFTYKIFTDREKGFGNEIVFNTNKLEYSSLQNKVNLINTLMPTGILTKNEIRQVFGFEEVEDGDEALVSLNYIKSSDMSAYQNAKANVDTSSVVYSEHDDKEDNKEQEDKSNE